MPPAAKRFAPRLPTPPLRPRIEGRVKQALREHWPEYLIEAASLGVFMLVACLVGALLEHPTSPVRGAIESPLARRFFMGLAMGGTAIAIVYSPFGKRSGAHVNPATTLTFLRLGKVAPADAGFYVVAQIGGGVAGVLLAAALLGDAIADPAVHWVATRPGEHGLAAAFAAETAMTFVLMSVLLAVSNSSRETATGLCCGALVCLYITFEAPISGMSLNPARTLASAIPAGDWTALWIYLAAPPLGMLAAAEVHLARRGAESVACAKLHHRNGQRCIFCLHQHGDRAAAKAAKAA